MIRTFTPHPLRNLLHTRALAALLTALMLAGTMSALCVAGIGCGRAEPQMSEAFNRAEFFVARVDKAGTHRQELIDDLRAARGSIDIAVSGLKDADVARALIDAHKNGVQVRVVSDWDAWSNSAGGDEGLKLLEDAGITPVYGDGPISYLPEPSLASIVGECRPRGSARFIDCTQGSAQGTMLRPGDYNLMSHNFAIIDEHTVWNFPALVPDQPWLGWRIDSSLLAYDFLHEFQQLHSGVFATTLDVYNGPVKSKTNAGTRYFTDQGQMRLWFNPQERLMKLLIDEVYKARASIWVMSDNIANPDLLAALEYKKANGFDVRVMAHEDHQVTGDPKNRLQALDVRWAPDTLAHLPSVVVIDQARDRNKRRWPRKALVLSHPLLHAAPYEVLTDTPSDRVFIYPSDLFVDGNLWQVFESGATLHQDVQVDEFVDFWKHLWGP